MPFTKVANMKKLEKRFRKIQRSEDENCGYNVTKHKYEFRNISVLNRHLTVLRRIDITMDYFIDSEHLNDNDCVDYKRLPLYNPAQYARTIRTHVDMSTNRDRKHDEFLNKKIQDDLLEKQKQKRAAKPRKKRRTPKTKCTHSTRVRKSNACIQANFQTHKKYIHVRIYDAKADSYINKLYAPDDIIPIHLYALLMRVTDQWVMNSLERIASIVMYDDAMTSETPRFTANEAIVMFESRLNGTYVNKKVEGLLCAHSIVDTNRVSLAIIKNVPKHDVRRLTMGIKFARIGDFSIYRDSTDDMLYPINMLHATCDANRARRMYIAQKNSGFHNPISRKIARSEGILPYIKTYMSDKSCNILHPLYLIALFPLWIVSVIMCVAALTKGAITRVIRAAPYTFSFVLASLVCLVCVSCHDYAEDAKQQKLSDEHAKKYEKVFSRQARSFVYERLIHKRTSHMYANFKKYVFAVDAKVTKLARDKFPEVLKEEQEKAKEEESDYILPPKRLMYEQEVRELEHAQALWKSDVRTQEKNAEENEYEEDHFTGADTEPLLQFNSGCTQTHERAIPRRCNDKRCRDNMLDPRYMCIPFMNREIAFDSNIAHVSYADHI